MRDEEYFAIKERAAAILLRIPHVNAVGIGGRERHGQPTGEIVIKVFVTKKKPAAEVPSEELIPSSFEGVPTDIVEMQPRIRRRQPTPGIVKPTADNSDIVPGPPLIGGMMLGRNSPDGSDDYAGTLGCFLIDDQDPTAVYALTNHHVVTDGALSLSRPIKQSSGFIGVFNATPIGYCAAGADEPQRDAAVVRLERGLKWVPAIRDIGFVSGTHTVTIAEVASATYQVRKRGSRTGLTGGRPIAIGVQTTFFQSRSTFDMVIRPNDAVSNPDHRQIVFSYYGDSGSVVVNDQNEVVGLLWAGEDDDETVTHPFLNDFVTPIEVVLKRFKDVDHLDLRVATPSNPNATEAAETREVLPPAGVSPMTSQEVFTRGDHGHHRPLSGGSQVVAEPFGFANSCTLGCIVTTVGHPETAYILTSYAGLGGIVRPPTTDTDVGQPDNSGSCSECCINTVGDFAAGGPDDATLPVALVKLKGDQKWLGEVMQIGLIEDKKTVTSLDVILGNYHVRKRGAGTRLTGGVVIAVGGVEGTLPPNVRPDAIIIKPHPNPAKPNQPIAFALDNDRGAAIVNEFNKVVGVLYDTVPIPVNGVSVIHGVALPIQVALDLLNALPGIGVDVPQTVVPDQVHTTAHRMITEVAAATPPVTATALEWLETELSKSARGRLAIALWKEHRGEIRALINQNRRVAAAWHGSGGPALLQALSRAFHMPSVIVPTAVNGRPISACIERLARAFDKHGSARLRADIGQLHSMLPSIGGRTLAELLTSLERG
ncbi:MAG TPA: hypothetical protein VGF24_30110 [Vicinamibacterales bacterium]|jgi:hypothetical protein